MNTKKIYDENGGGATRVFYDDKVERVNPIAHYKAHEINKRAIIFKDLLQAGFPALAAKLNAPDSPSIYNPKLARAFRSCSIKSTSTFPHPKASIRPIISTSIQFINW